MMVWHPIYECDKFLVKGTELSQALCGPNKRYALIEVRCYDKDNHADRFYRIRDAATVSDEDVKSGKRPKIVFETEHYNAALKYISDNLH